MKFLRWMSQHNTTIAVVLGLIVLIVGSILFWGILEGYVDPGERGSTGRKDVVQAFALILAGVVGLIGGIVGIFNLRQQRELDERRAQDEALQSYFEQIGDLITEHALMGVRGASDPVRLVANAQTLTVLGRLDSERRRDPLLFLYGAGLINRDNKIVLLRGGDLRDADLSGADLSSANLSSANLTDAVLLNADLTRANLGDTNLSSTVLTKANLRGAIVSEKQLATCESLAGTIMPTGAKYEDWRTARQNFEVRRFFVNNNPYYANLSRADLSGGDLRDTDLSATYLSGANLSGANLSGANLSGANLTDAYLGGANLTNTDLSGASLGRADLSGADLRDADLTDAWLSGADLIGANLTDADLGGANLSSANLSGAEVTEVQLTFSVSLQAATMPDGSEHR